MDQLHSFSVRIAHSKIDLRNLEPSDFLEHTRCNKTKPNAGKDRASDPNCQETLKNAHDGPTSPTPAGPSSLATGESVSESASNAVGTSE